MILPLGMKGLINGCLAAPPSHAITHTISHTLAIVSLDPENKLEN